MQVPTEINAPKSFKKNSQFAFRHQKGTRFYFLFRKISWFTSLILSELRKNETLETILLKEIY